MLFWRLTIGIPIIAILIGLCCLDASCAVPGLYLMPFFLICVSFLCKEVLELLNAGGIYPRQATVYVGSYWMMILCWFGWYHYSMTFGGTIIEYIDSWRMAALACIYTLTAMACGVIIAFVGEMARFKMPKDGNLDNIEPGKNTINLAGAVFAITYIGMLGCFMIMIRIAYGLSSIICMVIVTKMCDIGAYMVGRMFGRHKLVPLLSPGKTVEGAIGGICFAVLGSWFTMSILYPYFLNRPTGTIWGILVFGVLVGATGMLGDLAESLIKRDVQRKDSGHDVPGFGGFLDIFDSLLLAGPVAFGLWTFQIV